MSTTRRTPPCRQIFEDVACLGVCRLPASTPFLRCFKIACGKPDSAHSAGRTRLGTLGLALAAWYLGSAGHSPRHPLPHCFDTPLFFALSCHHHHHRAPVSIVGWAHSARLLGSASQLGVSAGHTRLGTLGPAHSARHLNWASRLGTLGSASWLGCEKHATRRATPRSATTTC